LKLRLTPLKTHKLAVAAAPVAAAPVAAAAPAAPAPVAAAAPAAAPADDHKNAMKSPMVGTAYIRPSPEAEPFVKVGDMVKAGESPLCWLMTRSRLSLASRFL